METIEQAVCELKQLAFTGSALPENVLLLLQYAVVAKVSHEVASNYLLKSFTSNTCKGYWPVIGWVLSCSFFLL